MDSRGVLEGIICDQVRALSRVCGVDSSLTGHIGNRTGFDVSLDVQLGLNSCTQVT